jgi:uncharacterized protein YukE
MSVRTFPGLGFDPAPGSPAALRAQAREADRAARALAGAAAAADGLDARWQGSAAEAYREGVRELPHDLQRAAAAHGTLARELGAYADDLAARQVRAADLESRAAEARRRAAARSTEAELEAAVADARRLLAEHRAAADAAAARIRAEADTATYRRPGLLARVRQTARGWVARHADVLTGIAHDLRGVSGVLGTASLVPGFQFLAPVAIAAGAAAVATEVAVTAATGRGSWSGLAVDTALTALPAGPVSRAVRMVPGVERALKAVNRAVPAGVRGRVFRTVRNLPEGISADQLAAVATRIRAGARGLTGDVVVQGSRAGHSARRGSDLDVGLRVSPEHYDRLLREAFGPGSTREAAVNAVARGRIFARHAGLGELRRGLEVELDRKVDLAIIKRGGMFDNEPWLRVP